MTEEGPRGEARLPEEEAALVRRCADGDGDAWSSFVERYGVLVAALARRMLQRRTGRAETGDVDEVVGEVFLALLRRDRLLLRRYDPRFRVSTYLGVIARTEVNRFLRRAGRPSVSLAGGERRIDPPAPGPGPLEQMAAAERSEALGRLREALGRLPDRDRVLLSLRYLEGLDYRSIGSAVGLSPDSVGQLLHRAKARLAREVPGLEALLSGPDS